MKPGEEAIKNCYQKAIISKKDCEKRQKSHYRENRQGVIEPMFLACRQCQHWLPTVPRRKVGGIWNQKFAH